MSADCPHCVFEKTEANCRGCFEGSHYRPKPITNADLIRSMTDEELAEWMANKVDCQYCSVRSGWCSESEASCRTNWFDWLKQEVEESE